LNTICGIAVLWLLIGVIVAVVVVVLLLFVSFGS
jgi:hypothetical protein